MRITRRSVTKAAGLVLVMAVFMAGCGNDATAQRSSTDRSPTASQTQDGSIPVRLPTGTWAGEQLTLTVTSTGATAEFDCAAGVVAQPLSLDPKGRFEAQGSYAVQSGGPVSSDLPAPTAVPALYHGHLTGTAHLTITITLPDSGTTLGPYELELNGAPSLERCL
jgi:hypothetical protein